MIPPPSSVGLSGLVRTHGPVTKLSRAEWDSCRSRVNNAGVGVFDNQTLKTLQNKLVLCVVGDGSLQMNIQELENIKNLNLPIKIFLINNSGYGMIKQTIDTWMKGRYVGCDLKSGLSLPDFKRVSNAYGIHSTEINNHNDLHEKIEYVLKFKGPIVCDVQLEHDQKIIPKVKSGSQKIRNLAC